MSTLSDVQALYGSVRDTWAKSRADIIAHVALLFIVFVVCGASLPGTDILQLRPKELAENEWFKLAKDTGIIYASFVVPLILIAAYAALLRFLSQVFGAIAMMIFQPRVDRDRYRLLNPFILEPLALIVKNKDFTLADLTVKSTELIAKYQAKKSDAWASYERSIGNLSKNSQTYLGDFIAFIVAWILVFALAPSAPWAETNRSCFWPVLIMLICLAWFARFRVSRALSVLPSMMLMFASAMIRTDPDMTPLLEADDKHREAVRHRLGELLRAEQEADHRPSLRRFLRYRAGLARTATGRGAVDRRGGFPFRQLYERGRSFSWDKERYERYDDRWLPGYLAYLYYLAHQRLRNLASTSGNWLGTW
jgi:hypothetical protein